MSSCDRLPKMELPDDVLAIIREYSQPLFREYTHVLKLLRIEKWHTLKDKYKIALPVLKEYIKALEMEDDCEDHWSWDPNSKVYCLDQKWRTLTYLLYNVEVHPYNLKDRTVNEWI